MPNLWVNININNQQRLFCINWFPWFRQTNECMSKMWIQVETWKVG